MPYLKLLDRLARLIPRSLLAPIALPLAFHQKTYAPFLYENLHMIEKAFNFLVQCEISGDYMEFGVYEGRTFTHAYQCAQRCGFAHMRFYLFDSFRGLPSDEGEFRAGQFSASRKIFEQSCRRYRVKMRKVTVTEGFYQDTLPHAEISSKVCFAWIDCDLYESTVPVLDFLSDKLVDGAIIVFDDWFCFKGDPNKGEQLACREWLQRNPSIRLSEYCPYNWCGKAFIVNR